MNENDHNPALDSTRQSADIPNIEVMETKGEAGKISRMALYLALLALFFTALGITVGYKHWLRIHDKAKLALTEITVLKEQLSHTANNSEVEKLQASLTYSANEAEQRLTNAIEELNQIRKQTTYSASTVSSQIRELTLLQSKKLADNQDGSDAGIDRTDEHSAANNILQTEVRFLLESAQRSLLINHDKVGSLQQLKAADQLLIQTASEKLLLVREKIAQDITRLEQVSIPNIEELSQLISQLENDIKPLSDLETSAERNVSDRKNIELFKIDDKNTLTGKVKSYLNDSVTIRKQAEPPRYALSLVDKQRTDQLLKLRLESLRLMLLQHHNITYHQQINTIKHMLDLYYSPVDTQAWLVTLNKLSQQNLAPSYPDISTALKQLIQLSAQLSPQLSPQLSAQKPDVTAHSSTASTSPTTQSTVQKDKE